jgi:hypothetical protein
MSKKVVELDVRVKTALEGGDTLKTFRELKQVQKELVAGSEDYKKVSQRMADIKDKTKTATNQSQDLIDTLASAPGPIGKLGKGLDTVSSSTNKFGLALKATGIGLVVGLVGQLVSAFSENEKAMKKLEPVMNAFQKILGGIFAALEPVLDVVVDLALKAMPALVTAINVLYTSFAALGSFIKNFFVTQFKVFQSFGKVLQGVFTLDYDLIEQGINDVGKSIKEGVKGVIDDTTNSYKRFNKGTQELTAIDKKNLEERDKNNKEAAEKAEKAAADAASKAADARKKAADKAAKDAADALATRKADLDARIQLEINSENTSREKLTALYDQRLQAELQGQKMTDAQKQVLRTENAKKVEDALKADKDARQKDFDDQIKQLQEASKLQIDQLTANLNQAKAIYGDNSKEARASQDAIFKVQSDALENEKDLLDKKKELSNAEISRLKNIAIEQQNLTTTVLVENKRRIESDVATFLKKQEEQKKSDDAAIAQKMLAATGDFEAQQAILDARIEQDRLYYERLLANENLSAEQRKVIQDQQTANVKANADAQIAIEQKKFQAQQSLLGATANAITAVADIIGKNTVAGKALAVAASLINTYTAIAGQLAAFAKVPVPGYAVVQAVATGLIGFKAVKDIISTPIPNAAPSSAAGSAASSNTSPSLSKPRGLARGGFVSGPGSGTSDSIPALLSNGESVINAASTAMFKPLLSTINTIGGGRRFASGGIVSSDFNQTQAMTDLANSLGTMSSSEPIKTYVVAKDITNQQMMDRAIKSRSTI